MLPVFPARLSTAQPDLELPSQIQIPMPGLNQLVPKSNIFGVGFQLNVTVSIIAAGMDGSLRYMSPYAFRHHCGPAS